MTAAGPTSAVSPEKRETFYTAAVAGLRALDARERTPRRFGADADTRWANFRGSLTDGDRIDFLLRDASVTWGAAFSPAEAFGLFGLAPDEPFGPDWQPLSKSVARRHLDGSGDCDINELENTFGVNPKGVDVPSLSASTRLVVAGGGALVAVAKAFASKPELVWSDQVLAVATSPAHRQLAGLLAIFVGSPARTRLVVPSEDVRATLKSAGFAQLDVAVTSADAEAGCAEFARKAAGVA